MPATPHPVALRDGPARPAARRARSHFEDASRRARPSGESEGQARASTHTLFGPRSTGEPGRRRNPRARTRYAPSWPRPFPLSTRPSSCAMPATTPLGSGPHPVRAFARAAAALAVRARVEQSSPLYPSGRCRQGAWSRASSAFEPPLGSGARRREGDQRGIREEECSFRPRSPPRLADSPDARSERCADARGIDALSVAQRSRGRQSPPRSPAMARRHDRRRSQESRCAMRRAREHALRPRREARRGLGEARPRAAAPRQCMAAPDERHPRPDRVPSRAVPPPHAAAPRAGLERFSPIPSTSPQGLRERSRRLVRYSRIRSDSVGPIPRPSLPHCATGELRARASRLECRRPPPYGRAARGHKPL